MTVGQAGKYLRRWSHEGRGGYTFYCPGCGEGHTIQTEGNGAWSFNGDLEEPTFSPSVLLRSGHYASTHKPGDRCWCTFNAERAAKGEAPSAFKCGICHSFVENGTIRFLRDCTHALAGKTVPLPELPDHVKD